MPEAERSYSSVYNDRAVGTYTARSALDGPQAWSAKTNDKNQWVQLDLGELYNVNAVQMWKYYGGKNARQYCGQKLELSEDGKVWVSVYDAVC